MKKIIILPVALILLSSVIFQTGCLDKFSNDQYPDVVANSYTINGVVKYRQTDIDGTALVDWKFGEATVNAVVNGNVVIATTRMDADGTFSLELPSTIPGTYFNSLKAVAIQQGGTIKAIPDEVRLFGETQFKVEYTYLGKPKSISISLAKLNTNLTVNRSYYFNFYDLDGTFKGSGTSGNVFDWTFTKGWGLVESYITNASTNTFNSRSITAIPSGAVWAN